MIFDMSAKTVAWETDTLLNKQCLKSWITTCKKKKKKKKKRERERKKNKK